MSFNLNNIKGLKKNEGSSLNSIPMAVHVPKKKKYLFDLPKKPEFQSEEKVC